MTEQGIPHGWKEYQLGDLFEFSNGVNADKSAYGDGFLFANVFEVITHESLTDSLIPGRVKLPTQAAARYRVKRGDVLFNRTSETQQEVGLTSVYLGDSPIVFGGFVIRGRPRTTCLDVDYSKYALRTRRVREQIVARGQGAIRANIGQRDLKTVRVVLPPCGEQRSLAQVLSNSDELIRTLRTLISKRQAITQGVMQKLLTGQTRLPGFSVDWKQVKLRDLLSPRPERNTKGEFLEVLSCTKHLGFVRSLDFFQSQVFSRDLSSYMVIHRGDIGYPANHVEEGSIGVQELVDRGLVSPIYVVMRPQEGVDTHFLQRKLKSDSFRQEFSRITNASVNRRGSLRWNQFSQISLSVPEPAEQRAISLVLRDAEAELILLRRRLQKAIDVRSGMIEELLTGRSRIAEKEVTA